jgi:hypothetical protein
MFTASLIGQAGWSSKWCVMTWKIKATKYHRLLFQLRVLARPTNEIGVGRNAGIDEAIKAIKDMPNRYGYIRMGQYDFLHDEIFKELEKLKR